MRYDLTCPNCGHVKSAPFIREGAVCVCPSCAHRFPLKADYVKQVAVPLAALRPGEADPLLAGATLATPQVPRSEVTPPPEQLAQVRPPTIVPGPAAVASSPATAASPASESPPAAASPPGPDRRAQRLVDMQKARQRQTMMLVAGVAIVMVLGLVIYVIVQTAVRSVDPPGTVDVVAAPGTAAQSVDSGDQPAANTPVLNDNMPTIRAIPTCTWYTAAADEMSAGHVNPSQFELQNVGFAKVSGSNLFEATLVGRQQSPNAPTTFRLGLVDSQGRIFAWYDQPLLMTGVGAVRERINITLSDRMRDRVSSYVFDIKPGKAIGGGDRFKDIEVVDTNDGFRPTVRVSAYNPLQREAGGVVVVLTAFDRSEVMLGRWIAEWEQPIASGQRVEFKAILENQRDLGAYRWSAEGVALIKAVP